MVLCVGVLGCVVMRTAAETCTARGGGLMCWLDTSIHRVEHCILVIYLLFHSIYIYIYIYVMCMYIYTFYSV